QTNQQASTIYPPETKSLTIDKAKNELWNEEIGIRNKNCQTHYLNMLAIYKVKNETTWNEEISIRKVDKRKSPKKKIDMLLERVSQPGKQTNKQVQYTHLKPKA
ncbi:31307_t:CDS:1, partial [Racocetra persica]